MQKQYVPSLNGLRAISIGIVILFHAGFRNLGFANIPGGQFGVNIFFIVSGFLITLLLIEEEKASNTISLKKFYLRRVFRIFPAYYFLLLVYYLLQLAGVFHFSGLAWLTAITYSRDIPFPKSADNWQMGHLWSLSVEEHFYLLWPVIFKFLKSYRVKIIVVLIILIPVIRGLIAANHPLDDTATIYERADALMWGCLLAIYYTPISKWIIANFAKYKFPVLIPLTGLVISVISVKLFESNTPLAIGVGRALGRADGTGTDIFICMTIVMTVNLQDTIAFKFLNLNFMNFIGKISYSLYIWQQLFFSDLHNFFFSFPINLLCMLAVAIASYYLIEKPFLKLKERFEPKRVLQKIGTVKYIGKHGRHRVIK